MPDPITKVDHIQELSILELILPKISGLSYGMKVCIEIVDEQLKLFKLQRSITKGIMDHLDHFGAQLFMTESTKILNSSCKVLFG